MTSSCFFLSTLNSQLFFSLKPLWISDIYLKFITHSTLHNLKSFVFPWQQLHKLFQLVLELWNLHTIGANKCAWIRALSLSLSLANLEITTVAQWQFQFRFLHVTWQQASKHINKSIICATVSKYRSLCLVVNSEKEVKGKFWSSWSKPYVLWQPADLYTRRFVGEYYSHLQEGAVEE